mgnify:CR=1 FL=1
MRGYGQFCPVAKASEILTERWTPLVVRELMCGSRRFNEIHRGVPLMSRGLLSQRLQRLIAEGVVERDATGDREAGCYRLTEAGEELGPIIVQLGEWGARWVRSHLGEQDLDATLLMWDMRRQVQPTRFPAGRVVVAFEFLDAPRSRRFWWLLSDHDAVDLCATDPGFEPDLRVRGSLQALTAVWLGDRPLQEELAAGRLEIHGSSRLRKRFPEWLALSPFAHVQPARTASAGGVTPSG